MKQQEVDRRGEDGMLGGWIFALVSQISGDFLILAILFLAFSPRLLKQIEAQSLAWPSSFSRKNKHTQNSLVKGKMNETVVLKGFL